MRLGAGGVFAGRLGRDTHRRAPDVAAGEVGGEALPGAALGLVGHEARVGGGALEGVRGERVAAPLAPVHLEHLVALLVLDRRRLRRAAGRLAAPLAQSALEVVGEERVARVHRRRVADALEGRELKAVGIAADQGLAAGKEALPDRAAPGVAVARHRAGAVLLRPRAAQA